MKPIRIQRSRNHKQVRPNEYPIKYAGRPTLAGNPFRVVKYSDGTYAVKTDGTELCTTIMVNNCRAAYEKKENAIFDAVCCYDVWFKERMKEPSFAAYIETLRGHNLSCWCRLDDLCHVDVILNELNRTK